MLKNRVITIASPKGGVGKSTASYHLAFYLANQGSVTLIDGDSNQSCSNWAERSPEATPFSVVGLQDAATQNSDYLILDSQVRLEEAEAVATDSTLIIIPSTTSALAVESAMNFAERLTKLGANYRILLQMVDPRAKKTAMKALNSLSSMGYTLLGTWIRSYSAYEVAALAGLPVNRVTNPYSGVAWSDYKALGTEVIEILKHV